MGSGSGNADISISLDDDVGSVITTDMTTSLPRLTTEAMTMTTMAYNSSSMSPLPGDMEDAGSSMADMFIYVMGFYLIPIILSIALISNILILIILPKAKIPPTFMICLTALTVSDALASAFGLAHTVMYEYVYLAEVPAGRWDKLAFLTNCLYLFFYLFLCYSAGVVITIVAIRHRLVSNPLSLRKITPRMVAGLCIAVFIGTVTLTLLAFGFAVWWQCYDEESTAPCIGMHESIGMVDFLSGSGYYVSLLTIIYGPFLICVNLVCLYSVRRSIKRREKMVNDMTSTGSDSLKRSKSSSTSSPFPIRKRRQKTSRVTRVIMIILAVDSILSLPSSAEAIALLVLPDGNIFHRTTQQYRIFDNVSRFSCALKLLYTFYLYATTHKEFNAAVLVALSCVKRRVTNAAPAGGETSSEQEPPVVVAEGNVTTVNVTLDEDSSNMSSSTTGLRL